MDNLLKAIKSTCTRLLDVSPKLLDQLSKLKDTKGQGFNLDAEVPGTVFSINQHHQRISAIVAMATEISGHDRRAMIVVSAANVEALRTSLDNIHARIVDTTQNHISQFEPNGGVGNISPSDFGAQSVNGSYNFGLTEIYRFFQDNCDNALQAAHVISAALRVDTDQFSSGAGGIFSAIAEQITQIGALKEQASAAVSAISALQSKGQNNVDGIETDIKTAKTAATEARASADKATSDVARITALLNETEALKARAETLAGEVAKYDAEFKTFDGALKSRNEAFEKWSKSTTDLIASLTSANTEALSTIENSKSALRWATVDGLSSSFTNEINQRLVPLRWTVFGFYVALMALAASVIAIFVPQVHEQLPSFKDISPEPVTAIIQLLSAIGVRLFIVTPALVFVMFTYNQYNQLFRTREYYSYKRTIAASVPGFKAEASSDDASAHVKDVTVAAFERLLFDHVDNEVQKKTAREQIGWLSSLYSRFRKPLDEVSEAMPKINLDGSAK